MYFQPKQRNPWGEAIGGGIADALNMLTARKLEEMGYQTQQKRQQEERNRLSNIFQQADYDPQTAAVLGELLQQSPTHFHDILRTLGQGGYEGASNTPNNPIYNQATAPARQQGAPVPNIPEKAQEALLNRLINPQLQEPESQQTNKLGEAQKILQSLRTPLGLSPEFPLSGRPPMPPEITQKATPAEQLAQEQIQKAPGKKPSFASAIAQGFKREEQEKPLSAAEQKHHDEVINQKDRLVDIIQTSDRLLQSLDEGVSAGVLPTITEKVSPSYLNTVFKKGTEQFSKDANHLLNLGSAELKGAMSKYRVQVLEKEKPSLSHSENVNRQIINRTRKNAINKLRQLEQSYPFAKVQEGELSPVEAAETAQAPSEFMGNAVQDDSGNYFLWDKSQNKYRPAVAKGA